MSEIDLDNQHVGYVVRDAGISQQDWISFASATSTLRKQPPKLGINPFTRQPMQYHSDNFVVLDDNVPIGLAGWEESECIWLAGEELSLKPFIALLCKTFHGTYEPIRN